MGRGLKAFLIVVIAVGVTLAAGAVGLMWAGLPTYDVPTVVLPVGDAPALRERGRALVRGLCWRCHFDPSTGGLTGRADTDVPAQMGTISAPNLTQHGDGLGGWTPGDLAYVLRTGVNPKTTRIVPPWMPRWPRLADDDAAALAAFLLDGDHLWVQARAGGPPPSRYSPYVHYLARTGWDPMPYPMQPVPRPTDDDPVAYGRYLVADLYRCHECHHGGTVDLSVVDEPLTATRMAGGAKMADAAGEAVFTTNLTPHADGLERARVEDLRRVLVDGFDTDGNLVRWPMPRYPELHEVDVEAIFAFLQTLEPVAGVAPEATRRVIGPKADPGRHVYERVGCPVCHDHDGEGIASLHGMETDDASVVRFILHPDGDAADIMPAWDGHLTDREVRDLVTHLRTLVSPP